MSEPPAENGSSPQLRRWWHILTMIGIGFIALGNASDAMLLIRELSVEVYSYLSNEYEYQTLASIHIGNTVSFVEEIVGKPQVSRAIDAETTANYFHENEYLLTLFYNSHRITAFTWISLDDDFTPDIDMYNGDVRPLGKFSFSDLPLEFAGYTVDDSRIVRFYIESLNGGRASGFLGTYLGNIEYGAFEPADTVGNLYQAEVIGDNEAAASAKVRLREKTSPNLYGRGNLPLDMIEKSILSNSEFAGYFGVN